MGDVLIDSGVGPARIRVTATVDSPSVPPTVDSPSTPDPGGYYQGDKLATWWRRAGAHLIDLLALISGIVLGGLLGSAVAGTLSSGGGVIAIVAAAAIWLYNRCYLQGRTGQSWGKRAVNGQVTFSWPRRRAMGLKLIRMSDKEPVGSWKAAIRNLAHALDNIPTLYLLPIWNARRQTLADKAMKTVVISLRG